MNFITCFSFIFVNLEPISIIASEEIRFYFNYSKPHYIPRPYDSKPTQFITKINNSFIDFISTIRNISFELHYDLSKICRNSLLDCPWYFRCEDDKYKLIEINEVCDFNFD